MLAAALAAAVLASGASSSSATTGTALGVTAHGGPNTGGAAFDLAFRTEHVTVGLLGGPVVLGPDLGLELALTMGGAVALASGTRVELLLDGGMMHFSRDDSDDDDIVAVLGSVETTGSSATVPFAQARLGVTRRGSDGRRLVTFGVFARTVQRQDVVATSRTCTLAGLLCGPPVSEPIRYGGDSVGLYLGFAWMTPALRGGGAPESDG